MTENRIMRQDNKHNYKRIHLTMSSDLLRHVRAAAALDEESISLWLFDAIQRKLKAYPFFEYTEGKL